MTSWECYENEWFYMEYIGKMEETESLLSTCCTCMLLYNGKSIHHVHIINYLNICRYQILIL
jgi:hypothetical protein